MNDHGPVLVIIVTDIAEVETLRGRVIELDRAQLPFPPDRIGNVEVDLRAVEGAVARLQFIWQSDGLERTPQGDLVREGRQILLVRVGAEAVQYDDLCPEFDDARVLLIAHSANRWALEHLLLGTALEELVLAPFDWQEGWSYRLDFSTGRRG